VRRRKASEMKWQINGKSSNNKSSKSAYSENYSLAEKGNLCRAYVQKWAKRLLLANFLAIRGCVSPKLLTYLPSFDLLCLALVFPSLLYAQLSCSTISILFSFFVFFDIFW